MGCTSSSEPGERKSLVRGKKFHAITDKYQTLSEVQEALRKAGLESSNLIIGVDFTKSNTWNGKITFQGRSLHHITPNMLNPYQEAISIIGKTLEAFDDDKLIPAYGFGDVATTDKSVFPFFPDRPCYGFEEVLQRYSQITPGIVLSGPTSFAPLIREAVNIVIHQRAYHILVIVCDGEVVNVNETRQAIIDASKHPLSIICVGVGDGPWDRMREFDDKLPQRKFDNFQFVEFHSVMSKAENREVDFAIAALTEIPEQYMAIKKLHYLS